MKACFYFKGFIFMELKNMCRRLVRSGFGGRGVVVQIFFLSGFFFGHSLNQQLCSCWVNVSYFVCLLGFMFAYLLEKAFLKTLF